MQMEETPQEMPKETNDKGESRKGGFAIIIQKHNQEMGEPEEMSEGETCSCPNCGCKLALKKAE